MANEASVYNLPMKQAGAFERNTEYRPGLRTTRRAREPPTTTLAYTRSEIAKKRATQPSQLQRAEGTESKCSIIHCAHGDDVFAFRYALHGSSGDGW